MKYTVYIKNVKTGHVFIVAKGLDKEEAEKMAQQYRNEYEGYVMEED